MMKTHRMAIISGWQYHIKTRIVCKPTNRKVIREKKQKTIGTLTLDKISCVCVFVVFGDRNGHVSTCYSRYSGAQFGFIRRPTRIGELSIILQIKKSFIIPPWTMLRRALVIVLALGVVCALDDADITAQMEQYNLQAVGHCRASVQAAWNVETNRHDPSMHEETQVRQFGSMFETRSKRNLCVIVACGLILRNFPPFSGSSGA